MGINYIQGDATAPRGDDPRIIVHVCNDIGGWGRGFVLALSKRWKEPEERYRAWSRGEETVPFALGQVLFVEVEPKLWVANMVGQHDMHTIDGVPPVRYEAIREGLGRVRERATSEGASVHMPRIGAGLAGGEWEMIEKIIEETLIDCGVEVTVYDLPQ